MTKHFLKDMEGLATSMAIISTRVEGLFRAAVDSLLARDAEKALEVMTFSAAESNKRYAEFCIEMQKMGIMGED